VLHGSRVQAAGPIADLLAAHRTRTGTPIDLEDFVLEHLSRGRAGDADGVAA
jgi:hypothetical protein